MKVLLIGGSGCLGQEIIKLNPNVIAPCSSELDVSNKNSVYESITKLNPDLVIHAAAVTDNRAVEKNPVFAIQTNIVGTSYISQMCYELNIRLVYISTDYIYEGDRGNYKESDPVKPFNLYSHTKLGGECSVVCVPNHLIIRTSFGKNTFDYKEAFVDKWSSKDWVDQIAPLILEAATSPLTGVLNLGTERKTLYDHASERSEVKPVKIAETNYFTPYDTSLNLQKWIDYKSSKSIAKPHCKCRVCGSEDMEKYLDLGLMPLANNLEFTAKAAKEKERFPLQVMFCKNCALSQLSVVIDPETLFSYYTYRSGVSQGYLDHCKSMAEDLIKTYELNPHTFHIDIAGNDGSLLIEFKKLLDHRVLNIDPASNLCTIAENNGIESVCEFWSSKLAYKLSNSHGEADLITATNVFAHLDDIKDFMIGANDMLSTNGIIVIENPYLTEFIENVEYCQTYFEHVSYLSLKPIIHLCDSLGLLLIDAVNIPIHSGSMRYIIAKRNSNHSQTDRVLKLIESETSLGYGSFDRYLSYQTKVKNISNILSSKLIDLVKNGSKIVGFGASAKGSTLLNYAGINTDLMVAIIDDTIEKIGKYSPGNGIPIVSRNYIRTHNTDYIVILAWNFKHEIIKKLRDYGYKGKFIVPAPVFEIIE